ncbi:ankyrin repeat-containing domain protein [Annulohypoxylon nitens]|nr:ankyrin repeat-containing domain protein [Annulohypoxylon nitens]
MASFNSLPNEVLFLIVEFIPKPYRSLHLAALALTCRRLYHITNPILWIYNRDQENSSAVIRAARRGRIEALEKALIFSLNLNTHGKFNKTSALYSAVLGEQVETVDWLLDHGLDLDTEPDDDDAVNPDTSPLYCALQNNQSAIALRLISKGACVMFSPLLLFGATAFDHDDLDGDGIKSAIHVASYYGLIPVVRYLAKCTMMDINYVDSEGFTCLHYAIMGRASYAMVNELIRLGIDVNLGCDKFPFLCLAIEKGYFEIADALINAGSRTNVFSPYTGLGPIHSSISSSNPTEQYGLLKKLIELGADVNGVDLEYQDLTPLGHACVNGTVEAMTILLQKGAGVDLYVDEEGRTPLNLILCSPRTHQDGEGINEEELKKKIKLLMGYSARLDLRWGDTSPLEDEVVRSIKSRDFEILDFMLGLATEKNLSTESLDNLLEFASHHNSIRCVKLLLEYGAKSMDFPGMMDTWVRDTFDGRYDKSVLFYGQDADFETLLNMWMDFNPSLDDKSVYFFMALKYRDRKAVDFLLSRGIAGRDEEYHDPIEWLQEAACWGHLGVLRRLLQYSPDINCFDDEDYLPLSRAVQAGHREAVILLMEHGADAYKSKATGDGQNIRATLKPIQHAIRRGDVGILTAILDKHKAPLSRKEAWVPSVLSSAPDIAEILALHPSTSDSEDI